MRKILIIRYLYYIITLSPKEVNLESLLMYDKFFTTYLRFQGLAINLPSMVKKDNFDRLFDFKLTFVGFVFVL